MNLWLLIFLFFWLILKSKSGKIRPNFDEIFGNGWNKNEREENLIKIEQNEQNEQNDNSAAIDQMGGEMGNDPNDQRKREIIKKFDAIKEKIKEKGKFEGKNQNKIEIKIGKLLGTSRHKIYKWKKELNLNKNNFYEEKKCEFIERFDEFKCFYAQRKQKEFVKKLGITKDTFTKWKKELAPKYNKTQNKYSNEQKLKMLKKYFIMKEANPKISDEIIAMKLAISSRTLRKWKREFE